jgi:hypothetical protein
LLKEKFGGSNNLGSNNDPINSASLNELKKLDLFDLGVLLMIAATGGLDVISEEIINTMT